MSFLFYIMADSFLSFNCVLSRIWQFIAGIVIYDKSNMKKGINELEEEELWCLQPTEDTKQRHFFCLIAFVLSLSLLLFPLPIDPLYSR